MILDDDLFDGFEEWADQMSLFLDPYGIAPTILSPLEWQQWAYEVCQIQAIAACNPPSPEYYKRWREWAKDFNLTVSLPT